MKKQSIITVCIAIAACLVMVSCGTNNAGKVTEKTTTEIQPNLPTDSTAIVADSLGNTKSESKENEANEKNEKK